MSINLSVSSLSHGDSASNRREMGENDDRDEDDDDNDGNDDDNDDQKSSKVVFVLHLQSKRETRKEPEMIHEIE